MACLLSPQADFNFIWRQCFYRNIQSVPCRQTYGHKLYLPRQKKIYIYMGEIWWLDFGKKQNFRQNLNQCQLSFLVPLCVHGRERGRKIWMSKKNMQSFQPLQNLPISVFAVSLCLNFSMIELTSNCSYVHVQKKGERYERKNMQNFQPL